ncbi:alpha-mannosidase [Butyrivibrio sp. Su6]|uniref:alpha-mannosidase n=1 Tax=Butyrivibrio sp. Su6 TaxID=1520810 RepID=UPI00089EA4ED|nr:glycoside hydrolase family 38 C-terminal domain-containing protein [Butyrivibrio sp. Su6]SEG30408.1 alpha-mannosidase [Butyrivibrio sp. Su6]
MGKAENYNKIKDTIEMLENSLWEDVRPVDELMTEDGIRIKDVPYGSRETVLEDVSGWDKFEHGASWGEPDKHYCFHVAVEIPEIYRGKGVLFFLSTGAEDIWNTNNPQMLVYINGKRRCGMDINHNSITIFDKEDWACGKDRLVDIRIYAYSNLDKNENYLKMTIAARNEAVQKLYFDLKVPFEAMQAMLGIPSSKRESVLDTTAGAFEEQNKNVEISDEILDELSTKISTDVQNSVKIILDGLSTACGLIDVENVDNKNPLTNNCGKLAEAADFLRKNLYGKDYLPVTVASVGHTHIDVAWKWRIRQTREKVIRSYSTVMELMKKYPEYLFMASTPQMYEFVKEEEPELFEEIKEKVKEGRFEPEGAMWLEADCNLTSGESLVRQILYGKEYFEEEFGVDSKVLWLPDVFGYSAALPQILKKSGIKAFMTTKVAWNDTNRMPHDLFNWEGIDGSVIPTYIITTCDYDKAVEAGKDGRILNYTYNGRQNASQVMGAWEAFREKDLTDIVLDCYGYGDGGGGPTWEMLEMSRRLELGIPGVPRTRQESVGQFFEDLLRETLGKDVPTWKDELYLEYHRGTYTSIGKNKKNNRRSEYLLAEAELLSVCAFLQGKSAYPAKEIKDIWKKIMLNQFHDILPGSSIEEVYQDSDVDYADIKRRAEIIIDEAVKELDLSKFVCHVDNAEAGDIACGEKKAVSNDVTCENTNGKLVINTRFYTAVVDSNGELESLFDKKCGKELRDKNQSPLNRLIAFEDKPKEYDCWNIDADFENVSWDVTDLSELSVSSVDNSGKVVISIKRPFRNSEIQQNIHFYADSKRIDFETIIDWHEHQTLLKAAFPVDVDSEQITCETQYGNLKRNLKRENSWDRAKFECCAHKWMDISDKDGSFGVAVLNDCKYGYDAKEKLMRLTLIKSGIFPNPNADQGLHEFTYSLFPHEGDYREGRVIEEARMLNENSHFYIPEIKSSLSGQPSDIVAAALKGVIDIEERGVFVEAVKMAENSNDIVIRLFEGYGEKHTVKASLFTAFDIGPKDVAECDLLERKTEVHDGFSYDAQNKLLSFEIEPFEIKTFVLSVS